MRKKNSKGKNGILVKCPKCGYKWKTKNSKKRYICCASCRTTFISPNNKRKRKEKKK